MEAPRKRPIRRKRPGRNGRRRLWGPPCHTRDRSLTVTGEHSGSFSTGRPLRPLSARRFSRKRRRKIRNRRLHRRPPGDFRKGLGTGTPKAATSASGYVLASTKGGRVEKAFRIFGANRTPRNPNPFRPDVCTPEGKASGPGCVVRHQKTRSKRNSNTSWGRRLRGTPARWRTNRARLCQSPSWAASRARRNSTSPRRPQGAPCPMGKSAPFEPSRSRRPFSMASLYHDGHTKRKPPTSPRPMTEDFP